MFKTLILASATAAVALTAAADFSAGTFGLTAAAEARSATVQGQTFQPKATVDLRVAPVMPATLQGSPGHFYCAPLWGGNPLPTSIVFYVLNDGNTNAGPVSLRVEFKGAKAITKKVNSVPAGAGGAHHVDIPASAWQSGTASFTIRVDHPNKVAETNEHNNVVSSFCTGPQG